MKRKSLKLALITVALSILFAISNIATAEMASAFLTGAAAGDTATTLTLVNAQINGQVMAVNYVIPRLQATAHFATGGALSLVIESERNAALRQTIAITGSTAGTTVGSATVSNMYLSGKYKIMLGLTPGAIVAWTPQTAVEVVYKRE